MSCSVSLILTLTWDADILFENVIPETPETPETGS